MRWQSRVLRTAGGSLEAARRRFERWRKGRNVGRIPHELWEVATSVAVVHGVELTAARLRLNPRRLQQWLAKLRKDGRAAESGESMKLDEFVEFPLLNSNSPAECTLELEEPSGRKLRISLKGPATKQALELGQLLGRSAP